MNETIRYRLIDHLKAEAKDLCEGCATSWKLDGWIHAPPSDQECTAKAQRAELRRLGAMS